jgi:hypothetical protein
MADRVRSCYLVVFGLTAGSHNAIKEFLDFQPEILNWATYMPRTFFVVSELTASSLAVVLRKLANGKARFIVLDVNTDRDGWLPTDAWEFMRNPKATWE